MKKILSLIACAGLIVTTGVSTVSCTNITRDQFSKIKGAIYDDKNNLILLPDEWDKLAESFGSDLKNHPREDDDSSKYWGRYRWSNNTVISGNVIIGTLQYNQSSGDHWNSLLTTKWLVTPERYNLIKTPMEAKFDF